ncbi:hypothetical protein [Actinomadura sp. 7K534]|uniref:hypothetical protein n=1 Tax=Actinomadura sp. 7K534 TaxID=2530366 RepID=UPI0010470E51|nr:hypothetical protein [Actinomadura sp. 7K534]TDB96749.1 hypothetical protein E1266_08755 [Actinomadura sp. 7K534]
MKDGYGSVGVHFGADTRFGCITYPDDPPTSPILTISTPGLSLTLSGRRLDVEAGDVQNARRLLEVVSRFTAEVERLHSLNNIPAESAEDTAA